MVRKMTTVTRRYFNTENVVNTKAWLDNSRNFELNTQIQTGIPLNLHFTPMLYLSIFYSLSQKSHKNNTFVRIKHLRMSSWVRDISFILFSRCNAIIISVWFHPIDDRLSARNALLSDKDHQQQVDCETRKKSQRCIACETYVVVCTLRKIEPCRPWHS